MHNLFKSLLKNSIVLLSIVIISFSNAQEKPYGKFIGAKESITPSWFYASFLDLNEDISDATSNNKRVILYVSQNNCPYCHKFVNENLKDEKTVQKIKSNFNMINIDMFGNNEIIDTNGNSYIEKEFAIKHKIQFTPTLIFYDENSKEILRLNGYVDIRKFNIALDYAKDKKEKELVYKEYLSNQLSLSKNKELIKSELFTSNKNFSRNKNSKEMAIFFESPNCDECETLHNKLLKDKTTLTLLKKLELNRVDINSLKSVITPKKFIKKVKDWTNELNITNTPTIIFFDEKGDEIIRVEGMLKNFHFQSIVDYVASSAYKEDKEFQRYLTKRANSIREKGIDVNIWD